MTKNAMVQFHDGRKTFVNTDLLTLDEAKVLFESHINDFKVALEDGRYPELVLWYPCETSGSYEDSIHYLHHGNSLVIDGKLYVEFQ